MRFITNSFPFPADAVPRSAVPRSAVPRSAGQSTTAESAPEGASTDTGQAGQAAAGTQKPLDH
jgi:hypothetical protein